MVDLKKVSKWAVKDWRAKVQFASPSGGGSTGVAYVWLSPNATVTFGRWAGRKRYELTETADFVVKPLAGSAAPTLVAEKVLADVAGAATPHSTAVVANSAHGQGIMAALGAYRNHPAHAARWNQVWPSYVGAQSFVLQDNVAAAKDLSAAYRAGSGLVDFLRDRTLMQNLGKLFVADAIIGNGDRLWKVNTGNIMFKPNGQFCAIDSTTVLANFNQLLAVEDVESKKADCGLGREYYWGEVSGDKTPQGWAKNQIGDGKLRPGGQEINGKAFTFTMETLWSIDTWWNEFKWHFEKNAKDATIVKPTDGDWRSARQSFNQGVTAGMAKVDEMFERKSFRWLRFKFKFFANRKKYGDDPNMDFMNFKIRRKYFQARRAGLSQEAAENVVLDMVKAKSRRIEAA